MGTRILWRQLAVVVSIAFMLGLAVYQVAGSPAPAQGVGAANVYLPLAMRAALPTVTPTPTNTPGPTVTPGGPTPTRTPSTGCMITPTLLAPANGSTTTTLVPEFSFTTGGQAKVQTGWLELAKDPGFASRAGSYGLYISDANDSTSRIFYTNLEPSTLYYWRAYLQCDNGDGPYSGVWSFTTPASGTLPSAPTLVSPAKGASIAAKTTFQWSAVAGALDYRHCYRPLGSTGYSCYTDLTATSHELTLSPGTTYEWWAIARSAYGYSAKSETWQVTVLVPAPNPACPLVPTLLGPANGSVLTTLLPTFTHSNGGGDARITGAGFSVFSDPNLRNRSSSSSQYQVPTGPFTYEESSNLSPGATYYWQAFFICGGDGQSLPSAPWSFTIATGGTLPPAPTLISPATGSTPASTAVTFQWSPVAGAVKYALHTKRVADTWGSSRTVVGTQEAVTLDAGTAYRWWVQAVDNYGFGYVSDTWQLTTPAGSGSLAAAEELATERRIEVRDGERVVIVRR